MHLDHERATTQAHSLEVSCRSQPQEANQLLALDHVPECHSWRCKSGLSAWMSEYLEQLHHRRPDICINVTVLHQLFL